MGESNEQLVRDAIDLLGRFGSCDFQDGPTMFPGADERALASLDALVAERDDLKHRVEHRLVISTSTNGEDVILAARERAEAAEKERDEWRQAASGRTVSCSQCDKANADWHRMRDLHADALTEVARLTERVARELNTLEKWAGEQNAGNAFADQVRMWALSKRAALAPKEER